MSAIDPKRAAKTVTARSHAYTLLSQLFSRPLSDSLYPYLAAIPALADHAPVHLCADDAAADYEQLFGFNLFPYESIFLGEDGLLGGPVTNAVVRSYAAIGFRPDTSAASPDHIGQELAALAFLCGAEAEAWEDGLAPVASQMRQHQATFLTHHLLRWLPPFAVAVSQQGHDFYSAVVRLTAELVADHFSELAAVPDRFALPPHSLHLDDAKTSLKDIAAYLMRPAASGLFLSRDDIGRLAHAHNLPRGFGSREQTFVNLLRAAVQYDGLLAVLASLNGETQRWREEYGSQSELGNFAAVWTERVVETGGMLRRIAAAVEAGAVGREDDALGGERL